MTTEHTVSMEDMFTGEIHTVTSLGVDLSDLFEVATKVLNEFAEDPVDEELVLGPNFVAEVDYLENMAYLLVSKCTQSRYLAREQLFIIDRPGKPVVVYSLSLNQLIPETGATPWNKVVKLSEDDSIHHQARKIAQFALKGELDNLKSVRKLYPAEAVETLSEILPLSSLSHR